MTIKIHDDHDIDDNERFEIQLSDVGRSPGHIGTLNRVGVTIVEREG